MTATDIEELRTALEALVEATRQVRLAYVFCPGSYTNSAFTECSKATRAIEALVEREEARSSETAAA